MPPTLMLLQQPIRLLERKQVQHQLPQLLPTGPIRHSVVQDPRVARRQDRVRPVRALGYGVQHAVSQAFETQAVG